MFLYEALGLCPEGHGGKLIDTSKWVKNKNGMVHTLAITVNLSILPVIGGEICFIGGRWVVNTSGGLESKGIYTLCIYVCMYVCMAVKKGAAK